MSFDFDRDEKEYLEPPDDVVEDCPICLNRKVLIEYRGLNACEDCIREVKDLEDLENELCEEE